ncbi:holo-ACP synthase [Erwinia sp. 9145]|nr:holo-ACP synthase [Erwinia sp. 9145]
MGVDIISVDRIARALSKSGDDFFRRVLTPGEQRYLHPIGENAERFAGYWAAKEAAVKALGTGFRHGITFHDIEIDHDAFGCPEYQFSGAFLKIMSEKKIHSVTLSISHCSTHAVAVAAFS